MSIALHETLIAPPVRRRRRRRSIEIAIAREAWRMNMIAAGCRCERCGDAACVIVDDRRFCGDCYLATSKPAEQPAGVH